MSDRIRCCIPFCKRTAPREKFPDATEVICGKHYRLRPAIERRAYSRAKKRLARACAGTDIIEWARADAACLRLWAHIKRKITESVGGIG